MCSKRIETKAAFTKTNDKKNLNFLLNTLPDIQYTFSKIFIIQSTFDVPLLSLCRVHVPFNVVNVFKSSP